MNMENFSAVQETKPMSKDELEASKATLENLYNSFSKDPMMAIDARDIQKMITNIDLRIEGLNN